MMVCTGKIARKRNDESTIGRTWLEAGACKRCSLSSIHRPMSPLAAPYAFCMGRAMRPPVNASLVITEDVARRFGLFAALLDDRL